MPYPLAVISPSLGTRSETFIYRHIADLLPDSTVAIVRNKEPEFADNKLSFPYLLLSEYRKDWRWFYRGAHYFFGASKLSPIQMTVSNYLKEKGVKVILSEYLDQSLKWLEVAKELDIRFFAHAHGYDISKSLRNPDTCRRYLKLKKADGIITVSEMSRQRLISLGLNGDKIHVVPCGVDVPPTLPMRFECKTIRCLAVGRMVPKKAPLKTLDAFRQALEQCPQMRLDYVGTGQLFDEASKFVDDHDLKDFVTLYGSQPNSTVQDLMEQADIFLQHSMTDLDTGDEEGLPVAILEAMAKGLPVVSTRHAGIPEAVIEGATGYLVDEGDNTGMAQCLIRLGNNPELRKKFGYAGWERAYRCFSWDRERDALLNLLSLADKACKSIKHYTP